MSGHGVAVLGAGAIARTAHLPAYDGMDLDVVGLWSRDQERLRAEHPGRRCYATVAELLADERVTVVDIATPPGPRLALLEAAIEAGKHVLLQKPAVRAAEELPRLLALDVRARSAGLKVAVNQNARWAPAWRAVTLLLRDGAIGEVVGITHHHDKPLPPLVDTPFDELAQMLLVDYLNHWFDITAQWLQPARIETVAAHSSRVPGQPDNARNPWHATAQLTATTGASATLRIVGDAVSAQHGCPFWVHGTTGTIRGSILRGTDAVTLETGRGTREIALAGEWFVDGFAGTMRELLAAIDEDREPEHDVPSIVDATLTAYAARDSALAGGAPVRLAGGRCRTAADVDESH